MPDDFKAEESMAHESIADEFKPKVDEKNPWRMAYTVYEILKYLKKRNGCNIYGGEILKFRRKRSGITLAALGIRNVTRAYARR